jgi:putative acetyltransferase
MTAITIRSYIDSDLTHLISLFRASARSTAPRDYTWEQVYAWAPDTIDADSFGATRRARMTGVAQAEGQIAGFTDLEADGHVGMLYVHPGYLRRGVARALLGWVEERALQNRLERLYTEASITARPAFVALGYREITVQSVTVRGIAMSNFRMEKWLKPS